MPVIHQACMLNAMHAPSALVPHKLVHSNHTPQHGWFGSFEAALFSIRFLVASVCHAAHAYCLHHKHHACIVSHSLPGHAPTSTTHCANLLCAHQAGMLRRVRIDCKLHRRDVPTERHADFVHSQSHCDKAHQGSFGGRTRAGSPSSTAATAVSLFQCVHLEHGAAVGAAPRHRVGGLPQCH